MASAPLLLRGRKRAPKYGNASIAWMNRRYEPYWGDFGESQLDALHYAAENMREHAVSTCRYIVLITDGTFHDGDGGSLMTRSHVRSDLQGALCRVFISVWDPDDVLELEGPLWYGGPEGLTVNGGFDPSRDDNPTLLPLYPLDNLRAQMRQDLGLQ